MVERCEQSSVNSDAKITRFGGTTWKRSRILQLLHLLALLQFHGFGLLPKQCFSKMSQLENFTKQVQNFTSYEEFDNWLMTLSPSITPSESWKIRVPENRVRGCELETWITGTKDHGVWAFEYDSQAQINQGMAFVVCESFSGLTTEQAQQLQFDKFVSISQFLTMRKKRGLQAMINHIHALTQS